LPPRKPKAEVTPDVAPQSSSADEDLPRQENPRTSEHEIIRTKDGVLRSVRKEYYSRRSGNLITTYTTERVEDDA
jgi:hypothetical protein